VPITVSLSGKQLFLSGKQLFAARSQNVICNYSR